MIVEATLGYHLTLAEVHAALTYSYEHLDEIREEWREADRLIEARAF